MKPTFDIHIHLWRRPLDGLPVATLRSGERDQLNMMLALMDKHGVEKACAVAACVKNDPDNHEFVAAVCREMPDRFVMFSEIPLASPQRDELLKRTIEDWPAVGFRFAVADQNQPETWSGGKLDDFWARADDARLGACFNYGVPVCAGLGQLIERYPNITWIPDHLGRPSPEMTVEDFHPVLDLAQFPNVYVKVSAFYAFSGADAGYPYQDLYRFVVALRDAYGRERLMWGSDVPPMLETGTYPQSYQCLEKIDELSTDDLEWIFGRSAQQLFKKLGKPGA